MSIDKKKYDRLQKIEFNADDIEIKEMKGLRTRAGLSLRDVSAAVGIAATHLSRIENAKVKARAGTIVKLMEFYMQHLHNRGEFLALHMNPALMEFIDDWRAEQPDYPNRSEAARRLVIQALKQESEK